MTSAETDRDQGLLALLRSVGARLFYASTVTFHNEQGKEDEETDFLVGKLENYFFQASSFQLLKLENSLR